ncbi:MAG TPA: hypothetical protein VEB66_12600 [Opitutaceae bacterium]|nr:hypothetical protein [Opitutaceae bacterium]
MKTPLLTLLIAGALVTGCTREDRADAKDQTRDAMSDARNASANAYNQAKATSSEAWKDFKDATYEAKSDFDRHARAMQREFESQMSKLKAEYSEAQATASRKAAMDELKNADANYRQKLDALGNATADTWHAARDDVVHAWDRLQAAYAKARAD